MGAVVGVGVDGACVGAMVGFGAAVSVGVMGSDCTAVGDSSARGDEPDSRATSRVGVTAAGDDEPPPHALRTRHTSINARRFKLLPPICTGNPPYGSLHIPSLNH